MSYLHSRKFIASGIAAIVAVGGFAAVGGEVPGGGTGFSERGRSGARASLGDTDSGPLSQEQQDDVAFNRAETTIPGFTAAMRADETATSRAAAQQAAPAPAPVAPVQAAAPATPAPRATPAAPSFTSTITTRPLSTTVTNTTSGAVVTHSSTIGSTSNPGNKFSPTVKASSSSSASRGNPNGNRGRKPGTRG